jgi:hypothetical protein
MSIGKASISHAITTLGRKGTHLIRNYFKKSSTPVRVNTSQEQSRRRRFYARHYTAIGGAKIWERGG